MSKAHAGMSKDYEIKQKIRQSRTENRRILALAKEIYRRCFDKVLLERGKLTHIKSLLKAGVSADEVELTL